MKYIVTSDGKVYVRRWLKWYWLSDDYGKPVNFLNSNGGGTFSSLFHSFKLGRLRLDIWKEKKK